MTTQIIDNFLPDSAFKYLQSIFLSWKIPWEFQSDITGKETGIDQYQFVHLFYHSRLDYLLSTEGLKTVNSNNTNLQLVGSSSITGTDDILTLYNDNSIFSQLVQKPAGFSIPFIFQPNKNYARPDGFMYAVIDQNSIEIEHPMPKFEELLEFCKNKFLELRTGGKQ